MQRPWEALPAGLPAEAWAVIAGHCAPPSRRALVEAFPAVEAALSPFLPRGAHVSSWRRTRACGSTVTSYQLFVEGRDELPLHTEQGPDSEGVPLRALADALANFPPAQVPVLGIGVSRLSCGSFRPTGPRRTLHVVGPLHVSGDAARLADLFDELRLQPFHGPDSPLLPAFPCMVRLTLLECAWPGLLRLADLPCLRFLAIRAHKNKSAVVAITGHPVLESLEVAGNIVVQTLADCPVLARLLVERGALVAEAALETPLLFLETRQASIHPSLAAVDRRIVAPPEPSLDLPTLPATRFLHLERVVVAAFAAQPTLRKLTLAKVSLGSSTFPALHCLETLSASEIDARVWPPGDPAALPVLSDLSVADCPHLARLRPPPTVATVRVVRCPSYDPAHDDLPRLLPRLRSLVLDLGHLSAPLVVRAAPRLERLVLRGACSRARVHPLPALVTLEVGSPQGLHVWPQPAMRRLVLGDRDLVFRARTARRHAYFARDGRRRLLVASPHAPGHIFH